MDALLMCGGRGTRLRPAIGDTEKPLVEINGKPMVDHVLAALRESAVGSITAAVSPATPKTAEQLATYDDVRTIETPGEGYVSDLSMVLSAVETPVVTVTSDLPLLAGTHVDRAIAVADGDSLAVCVPLSVAERVGASTETTVEHRGNTVVPTGLNTVGDGSDRLVVWAVERLACNVNRPADLRLAEQWLVDSV
jgi:adenosylcobinamide-phosphate guanylyltransferase